MARGRRRKRTKQHVAPEPARAEPPALRERPSPVHAVELNHGELTKALAERDDRFSQLLARVLADERKGQYLVTSSSLSAEEHAELHSLAAEAHPVFRAELGDTISELRTLLSTGDPLYLTAAALLWNVTTQWGEYYEPTHRGGEHNVELVAGLLATQPVAADLQRPSNEHMLLVQRKIEQIQQLLLLVNLSMPRGDDVEAAALRFTGTMRWMFVRGESYDVHGKDLARAVYAPHDAWTYERYGFTIDDMLALGATVESLTMNRLNGLVREARAFAHQTVDALRAGEYDDDMKKDPPPPELSPDEVAEQVGRNAFIHHFEERVRDALTFSADELATANPSLPTDRIDAMLTELSIEVGDLDPSSYTGLFDESPFVERPILSFGDRYFLTVPGMLLRDPLLVLEDRFLEHNTNFSRSRARVLDRLAVRYIASMLPGSSAFTNLYYEGAELDGLVLFEDVAFVIEGKGTALSTQALRGDVTRLARDAARATEEAWKQGARARSFILADGDSVFCDEDGNEVTTIGAGSIKDVYIVNPTLHELGGHGPQLAQLRALGLFPEGELPWSVFVNDLRVISETCDNAAIFLHYLTWRGRLPLGDRITAADELDLWGAYLMCERFGILAMGDRASIANSTTDFDAYYAGVSGYGPEARRPRRFSKQPVTGFVERMANERPPGWREAAGACLDLSLPELAFVCAKAREVARRATRDREATAMLIGRVALVGVPRRADVPEPEEFQIEDDELTIMVFCRLGKGNRTEIVWARYTKPVTFELSEYERMVQLGPTVSEFTFSAE